MTTKLAGARVSLKKHAALTDIARGNHRTLSDHLRWLYDAVIEGRITVDEAPVKKSSSRKIAA